MSIWRPLTFAKRLASVTFCDTTAGIGKNESVTDRQTDVRMEVQTDVKSEIVIQIPIILNMTEPKI